MVVAVLALAVFATTSDAAAAATSYAKGIDVSHYQGKIAWPKVANASVTFAFGKATEGTTYTDPTYTTNRTGAESAGITFGAYHFARPAGSGDSGLIANAIAQADYFLDVAQPQEGELPPVLDLETKGNLTTPALQKWTSAWLTEIAARTGVAGLVCALVLGRRKGFGQVNMAPHNLVLTFIGAGLLWVGWFGFNAGSALAANGLAGSAMMNTQVATAAAGLSWMFVEWLVVKKPSVLGILSGAVAGLVAVTPASGFVNPQGAFIVGILAGAVCYYAAAHVKKMFGYDDSLDAFGVHGIGGILGALLTGFFADPAINGKAGLFFGNPGQVLTQIEGIAVTIVWTAVLTWVILMVTKMLVGLRPSEADEEEGLDISQHGESVAE